MQNKNYQNFQTLDAAIEFQMLKSPKCQCKKLKLGGRWQYRVYYW